MKPIHKLIMFGHKPRFFLITFKSLKTILRWKVSFSKNGVKRFVTWSKMEEKKKSTFFLKASEKKVLYILFLNHKLCDLKVYRSFTKIIFECVVQFLTILWSGLGGSSIFFLAPFFLNLDFTPSVARRGVTVEVW